MSDEASILQQRLGNHLWAIYCQPDRSWPMLTSEVERLMRKAWCQGFFAGGKAVARYEPPRELPDDFDLEGE